MQFWRFGAITFGVEQIGVYLILLLLGKFPREAREGYNSQIIIYRYREKILLGKYEIAICTDKTKPPPNRAYCALIISRAGASAHRREAIFYARAAATSVAFSPSGFRRRILTASIVACCFRWTGSGAMLPPWPEVRCVALRRVVLGIGVFLA